MIVVASGVIVRREPSGFTVSAWHRHEKLVRGFTDDDTYDHLTVTEMVDVVLAHLDTYAPGDDCLRCKGWHQPSLWASSGRPEGT